MWNEFKKDGTVGGDIPTDSEADKGSDDKQGFVVV